MMRSKSGSDAEKKPEAEAKPIKVTSLTAKGQTVPNSVAPQVRRHKDGSSVVDGAWRGRTV